MRAPGILSVLIWSYVAQFEKVLQGFRLKTGRQCYNLLAEDAGIAVNGTNIYGILRAPRGDATEAIVLSTCWRTSDGRIDLGGVSLLMSLAGYFKRSRPPRLLSLLTWDRLVLVV